MVARVRTSGLVGKHLRVAIAIVVSRGQIVKDSVTRRGDGPCDGLLTHLWLCDNSGAPKPLYEMLSSHVACTGSTTVETV